MSQGAEYSFRRSEMSELLGDYGEQTGLPMIKCPECNRARVVEALSKKQNTNFGRVYVQCSRNYPWLADSCPYYRFQKQYFNDLMRAKKIQVFVDKDDEIQEAQSKEQLLVAASPASGAAVLQSNELEAKVEKWTQAMKFFFLFAVAFISMGVGYALKYIKISGNIFSDK